MKIKHEADYRALRAADYPDVKDQLDALWHAMHRGEMVKIEPMYSQVLAVKEKHHKNVE